MRRLFALALAVLAVQASASTKKRTPLPAPAAIVIDTHADTPSEFLDHPFDLGARNSTGHFDYPRMQAGGLDAEFFAAYVPAKYAGNGAAAYCLRSIETIHEMVEHYPSFVRFAASTDDIRKVVAGGHGAILIGIEGGHAIEDSIDVLRAFYRLGARYMTLTHTNTNNWADSSGDEPKHGGLTDFGRQVVLEMNRLGMLVDVSHVSDETFYDVIETTKAPVFASHSSTRALCDNKRNMSDDMLRAIAKNHGVVMVNFYPVFLSNEVGAASRAREKKLAQQIAELKAKDPSEGEVFKAGMKTLLDANPLPKVSYTRIADHIDHIVKIAGIDHVGIGSDFDGIGSVPEGMEDVSRLPNLRAELVRRGYSSAEVRKIMGENFMRVFAAAESVAKDIEAGRK